MKEDGASALFGRLGPEKQARILAAAIEEFANHGFQDANVNRMARAAHISVGALYKYFHTKEAMYLAIVDIAAQRIAHEVDKILAGDTRFFSKVEKLLRMAQSYSREDPSFIKLYNVFVSENDPRRAQLLAQRLEGLTSEAYGALIRQAQGTGEVRADVDAGVLAYMLDNQLMAAQFSFACSYYMRRFSMFVGERDAQDDEYVINSMMKVLEQMLAPDKHVAAGGG